MKLEFYREIFKSSNIKFRENPLSGSRVVACGQTDGRTGRQACISKLRSDFRNFANAPDKERVKFSTSTA